MIDYNQMKHLNFMSKYFQSASLDHAMWFHSKVDFSKKIPYISVNRGHPSTFRLSNEEE